MSRVEIFTRYWKFVLVILSLLTVTISVIHVESASDSEKPDQVNKVAKARITSES